jgi:hypothetical protein
METSETTQVPVTPPLEVPPRLEFAPAPGMTSASEAAIAPDVAPAPEFQHCDNCGAPVDHVQRYCVSCGAHRRHVPDPAARYLSQASARSRSAASRSAPARRRGASLASAAVLALIPVAAAVGIEVGRSSNSQDSKLIQELARERTVVASTPAASSADSGSTTSTSSASKSHKPTKQNKSGATKATATAGAGKVLSQTKNGAATQITGSKVTSNEAAQGAAEAKTIQNSTGKNYVNAANNLPSTVVP